MRIRPGFLRASLPVLLGLTLLVGCSSTETSTPTSSVPAPSATDLISRAATAMKAVTSAHFVIAVTGTPADLTVQQADGDLTSTGSAQGTASILQGGQLTEIEFVIVDKDLYFKGPTGGFTVLPAALAGQIYDPTAILNPDTGVAKVLTSATGLSAVTESGDTYQVSGTVPKDVAASLTPGITADTVGTFAIDKATSQPASVSFGLDGSDGAPATVRLELSDLNKELTITAPAGS